MKFSKLLLIILLSVKFVFSQDIEITEIKVTEGFQPNIPQASRLNENATFADTIKKDRTQNYDVLDVNLKSGYKTKTLLPAKVKDDKISKLYATTVGIGLGSSWTTKARLAHNSRRSKSLSYGIVANHFSNKYALEANSRNSMYLYAKQINSSYIFLANLNYDRKTALYEETLNLEEKDVKNRFSYTKFSFSIISKEISNEKFKHYTTFFVSDLNEFSENQIHLSSNLIRRINDLPFSLRIAFNNYLNYNNDQANRENIDLKTLSFAPNILINKYGIDFHLGFDFDFVSNESSVKFSPDIKATKELVKDVVLIYGGLRHSKKKHTLKSLSDKNPYIHSFGINQSILGDGNGFIQELKLTYIDELYLTMRNMLAEAEIFEGSIAYGKVQNFDYFVGGYHPIYNRFQIAYLDDIKQLHLHANYDREVNAILSLHINADYYKWEKTVYYKPHFICEASTPINLRNKIKISPILTYISGRKAINSELGSPENFISSSKALAPRFQMKIELYYSYSKQLSAYLNLNNLTNLQTSLWDGYSQVGFNGVFGVNYSF